jgi:hypothetical protein
MKTISFSAALCSLLLFSCTKEPVTTPAGAKLIFIFEFDSTQVRLNNIGQPSAMPAGHAGQSPRFNSMSAHYIELAPTASPAWEKVQYYTAPRKPPLVALMPLILKKPRLPGTAKPSFPFR